MCIVRGYAGRVCVFGSSLLDSVVTLAPMVLLADAAAAETAYITQRIHQTRPVGERASVCVCVLPSPLHRSMK